MLSDQVIVLDNWTYARVVPGEDPREFQPIGPARAVGRILADQGQDLVEGVGDPATNDLDAFDHLYRVTLDPFSLADGHRATLCFPSLATVAKVYLNGEVLAESVNCFVPVSIDMTAHAKGGVLEVRCSSLRAYLDATKWPRPRFKTKLVADQRLRHVRTTLLGRIPSWSPPCPQVGISGPVTLTLGEVPLEATVVPQWQDGQARLSVSIALANDVASADDLTNATVDCHGACASLHRMGDALVAEMAVPGVQPWWPHTHGDQHTYEVKVRYTRSGKEHERRIATTGFRSLVIDRGADEEGFGLTINGVGVFARGSAWMPLDPRDPWVNPERLRQTLTMCRDAGINIIRITGTTGWEQPAFYRLCDELGLMVWQDLPLATLDQPSDENFTTELRREINRHLTTLASAPSVVVLCGASERQQQAAMLGLEPSIVLDAVGAQILGNALGALGANIAFVPCSPSGGHLPFAADSGVSHYYGVGAYLRALTDARHAAVRFTSECLAFANVPEPLTMHRFLSDGEQAPTHPRWKQRVPRDRGTGWDFDDVRDHYLRELTGLDPVRLRMQDTDRYLEVSRVIPGLVMAATMHEWRRPTSSCRGAITWFLRDLWRGAGWGLIDSDGHAKAAFHIVSEAWAPLSVGLIDEGLNGIDVWVHNDRATPFSGSVIVHRVKAGRPVGAPASHGVEVGPHASLRMRTDELFGRFSDPSHAYHFGPAAHDALTVRLDDTKGETVSRAVRDTNEGASLHQREGELTGTAHWVTEHELALDVTSPGLARFVRVETDALIADRHHVDITPGETRRVIARLNPERNRPSSVSLAAVNQTGSLRIVIPEWKNQ